MTINIWHMIGIIITLALITGVGIYSGSKVKNASDFTTGGGQAGPLMVCGAILGALVGGQATIGTAQLAFTYGMAAWWFTLGSGIGCLIMGIAYVIPLRRSGNVTLMEIIAEEFGAKAEYIASLLCSIGIFISIISQVISACALLTTIFGMNYVMAGLISIILMTVYIVFGGAWGAGMGGIVKLILLYMSSIIACGIVFFLAGGPSGVLGDIRALLVDSDLGQIVGVSTEEAVRYTYLNMIARGASKDIGSALSLVLGVLSTQTYAQAIWSGRSDSAARKGAFLCTLLTPPIGIACTMVGMFMRGHCLTTEEIAALGAAGKAVPAGMIELASTSQVFPMFIVHYMPALIGGIVLGTLFITVVGGGAGLSLGVATILVNDLYKKLTDKINTPARNLIASRLTIVGVLLLAMIVASFVPGAVINDFGFLSMGLRGTVVFLPMCAGLFLKGRIRPTWAMVSIILGPITLFLFKWIGLSVDPLFPAMGVAAICLCLGMIGKGR